MNPNLLTDAFEAAWPMLALLAVITAALGLWQGAAAWERRERLTRDRRQP